PLATGCSDLGDHAADGIQDERVEHRRGLCLDGVARGGVSRVVSRLIVAVVSVVCPVLGDDTYTRFDRMHWERLDTDVGKHQNGAESDQEPGRPSPGPDETHEARV